LRRDSNAAMIRQTLLLRAVPDLKTQLSRYQLLGRRVRSAMFLTLLGIMLPACNHLFYFPDPDTHWTPDQFQIKWHDVRFKSGDGTALHAWHLDAGKDALGTVLQFHGNAENLSTHFASVAWLVKAGYDVVVFDYRGYGKSAGKPERAGTVADGIAAINWVRAHPRLKAQPLFIIGQSLGGAISVPALVKAGDDGVRGLILDSTFHSYRGVARDRLGAVWLTWAFQWPLSFLITDELSPIDWIDRVRVPILFLHGVRDPVVPAHLGRKLFEAAPATSADGTPKAFWDIELAGHVSAFAGEVTPTKSRFVAWLSERSRQK